MARRPHKLHACRKRAGYDFPLCWATYIDWVTYSPFDNIYYAPTPEAVNCVTCRRLQESR